MNHDELVDLLTAVAVYDRRQVGRADITAWTPVVGDLDLEDCLTAVVAFRRDQPGVWLEPGHIRQLVKAAHRDRALRDSTRAALEAPPGVPMPDEMREQLKRIRDNWSLPTRTAGPPAPRRAGETRRYDQTDRDRAKAGRPTTICHTCAIDIPAPPGWDPKNPDSPPLHCATHRDDIEHNREAS